MGWIVAAVIAVALAVVVGVLLRRHRERLVVLRDEQRQRLAELGAEHDRRVDRLEREFDGFRAHAHLPFATDLLPTLDALEGALEQARAGADPEAIVEGLELTREAIDRVLDAHGIERIQPAAAEPFDPQRHEAIGVDDTGDLPDGTVSACHRTGYVHRDRVLRAAVVTVARAQDAQESADSEAPASQDMH